MALADGFSFDGDDRAILVIHGFTGAPDGLLYLGQRLAAHGPAVRVMCLPGHGTHVDDLDATVAEDWYAAVEAEFLALRARHQTVAVVGQSLGGLLALRLAMTHPTVAAVASLAAPLWLDGLGGKFLRWASPGGLLHGRLRRLPKLGGPDARDPIAKRIDGSYPSISVPGLIQLGRVMTEVRGRLDELRTPLLVIHATDDHTAPVAGAHELATRAHAERLLILPRSYHLIANDVERTQVADSTWAHLAKHLRA